MVRLAVTGGVGIGPEILAKALKLVRLRADTQLVFCDSNNPVQNLLQAIQLAQEKEIQGIVTGPVRKSQLTLESKSFPGQTEFLHHYLAKDNDPPLMGFAGAGFLLGLATTHVPLAHVSQMVTGELITQKIKRLAEACKKHEEPIRLAILGINPHSGENGLLGNEEQIVLNPTVKNLRDQGLLIEGPLSADGFFGNLHERPRDQWPHAVLAMYHDQGLPAYKLLGQGRICNITFGLSTPRTSPAHGTADDIAGKNIANPTSMVTAIEMAEQLALEI